MTNKRGGGGGGANDPVYPGWIGRKSLDEVDEIGIRN